MLRPSFRPAPDTAPRGTQRIRPTLLALVGLLAMATACHGPNVTVFYRPAEVGSAAQFDPLTSSLQYVLDGDQVESFETNDYGRDLRTVLRHLGSPFRQIEDEGGIGRFLNTEVFPHDPDNLDDSLAVLPNVFLHCFGGGMLFRKHAEWFAAEGYPAPWLLAGALAMTSEVLAEAIEKPASDDTDEIADVFLFRPLGLWIYSNDFAAQWMQDNLAPVDWPHQLIWDVQDERWRNVGMNYVFRPPWLDSDDVRLFAYTGMTSVFGLSHRLANGDTLSWGAGASTLRIEPVDLRWSAGLFYDRDDSLLWSVIANGAEGYALRANVYPGVLGEPGSWWARIGLFAGVTDDGAGAFGLHWRLPVGIGI
ncbi:MAG: hypothetical protein NXI31_02335 [bacterium]|nr:hypothetical protein [bacterium]